MLRIHDIHHIFLQLYYTCICTPTRYNVEKYRVYSVSLGETYSFFEKKYRVYQEGI